MGHRQTHARHPAHGEDSWDEHAPAYARQADESEPGLGAATQALLDAVQAGPGVHLLDLACGPGHTTAAAHARGPDVLGTDLSGGMIEQARLRFPSVAFDVGEMANPPPGPWDAITCRDGHHANPGWLVAAYRVLRRGGRIGLAETEPVGPGGTSGKVPADEWKRRLEEAGFEDVTAHPFETKMPGAQARPTRTRQVRMWIVAGRKP